MLDPNDMFEPLPFDYEKVAASMLIFGEPHHRTVTAFNALPFRKSTPSGDPWICRGRSVLAQVVIDDPSKFEWMFWVDQDIVFHPAQAVELVAKAVQHDCDILCGMYVKKEIGGGLAMGVSQPPGTESIEIGTRGLDPIPCYLPHMGFTAIHRRVFEGTDAPTFTSDGFKAKGWYLHLIDDDGRFCGEDHSFWIRAKAAGFKCWADPSCLVGHHGAYTYTMKDAYGKNVVPISKDGMEIVT